MRLYLVRHGEPVSAETNPARPLSEAGRTEAEKLAALLRDRGVQVAEILHSTKARAAQTAGILRAQLGGAKVIERPDLTPNDPVEPVAGEVEKAGHDLMIVGHLPFLPALASKLLGEARADLALPTCGVIVLARDADGVWAVEDTIP
jgi:phosphohistidine phosphatase